MELFEKIVNIQTGEETMRPYTTDEIAVVEAEIAKTQARLAEQATAEAERESALAKLAALGLTADDLKALGL